MTRNKYCDVCGTEQVRRRGRKQKLEPSVSKRKPRTKKRTVISLLAIFIILGVSVPVSVNHIVRKPHYEGALSILSVNIVPIDQEIEQLDVVFGVRNGEVFVKQIGLLSISRDKHYGNYQISFELLANELRVVSFVIEKNDPLFYEGFSLGITHKHKIQWITHLF